MFRRALKPEQPSCIARQFPCRGTSIFLNPAGRWCAAWKPHAIDAAVRAEQPFISVDKVSPITLL
jgi:hypothetical protein